MKISLVAQIAIASLALAALPTMSAAHAEATSPQFTDTEIAEGVLYGEGAFADAADIEPLSKASAASRADIANVQDKLLTTVEAEHSSELAAAADQIRSGDPYKVDDGVKQLTSAFAKAIESDYPEVSTASTVQPQCGVICVCVAGVEIAVVGGIAVAVVAETAVAGHFVLWTKAKVWNAKSINPDSTEDLGYTEYVAKIASAAK